MPYEVSGDRVHKFAELMGRVRDPESVYHALISRWNGSPPVVRGSPAGGGVPNHWKLAKGLDGPFQRLRRCLNFESDWQCFRRYENVCSPPFATSLGGGVNAKLDTCLANLFLDCKVSL